MLARAGPLFKPYKYEKKEYHSRLRRVSFVVPSFSKNFAPIGVHLRVIKTLVSVCFIFVGIVVLVTRVLVPVVVIYANTEGTDPVISPIPENGSSSLSVEKDEVFTFKELSTRFSNNIDYVEKDGIAFPRFMEEIRKKRENVPEYFYLSIPKLGIEDAKVKANSTNLDPRDALGHYNGSCLPDEGCNTFLFGHSTYTYKPNRYKDGDYTAIFSKLGDLEYGDEFSIRYKGKVYRYVVDLTKVQRPENVDPLGEPIPKSLGKYENTVELFTCTPPGTTKYRLSVVGKLVK